MGAALKSSSSLIFSAAALLVLVLGLAVQTQVARSQQNCSSELNSLTTCAPFVVPGQPVTTPNPACCSALQSVDHECLCNTLRIAARIPAACSLPPLTCS